MHRLGDGEWDRRIGYIMIIYQPFLCGVQWCNHNDRWFGKVMDPRANGLYYHSICLNRLRGTVKRTSRLVVLKARDSNPRLPETRLQTITPRQSVRMIKLKTIHVIMSNYDGTFWYELSDMLDVSIFMIWTLRHVGREHFHDMNYQTCWTRAFSWQRPLHISTVLNNSCLSSTVMDDGNQWLKKQESLYSRLRKTEGHKRNRYSRLLITREGGVDYPRGFV
jgi:hypothetical protein